MKKNSLLDSNNVWKTVFLMSLPAIISGLSISLIYLSDSIMASALSFSNSLEVSSGIGISISTIGIITSIVVLISTGGAVRFSYLKSKKNIESMKYTAGNSFSSSILFGLLISLLIIFVSSPLMKIQSGNNSEIAKYGELYLLLTASWIPLFIIYYDLSSYVRTEGKILSPILITITSVIVNLVANYVLLQTGLNVVIAVGIGTLISQIYKVIFLFLLIYSMKKKKETVLFEKLKYYKPNMKIILLMLGIGAPIILRNVFLNIDNIILATQLSSLENSSESIDANFSYSPIIGVYNQSYSIIINIINGFSVGAGTVIIYNFGRKNFETTKKSAFIMSIYIFITLIIFIVPLIAFSENLLSFFGANSSSIEISKNILNALSLRIFFLGLSYIIFTFFIYTFQIYKSLFSIFAHTIIIFIPLTYIFTSLTDSNVSIFSYLFSDVIYLLIAFPFFLYDLLNIKKLYYSNEIDILAIKKLLLKIQYISDENMLVKSERRFSRNVLDLSKSEDTLKKIKYTNNAYKNVENISKIIKKKNTNIFYKKNEKLKGKKNKESGNKSKNERNITYMNEDNISIVDTHEFKSRHFNKKK